MRREHEDCPICGARLGGSRFIGYTCSQCHSHFSARFMARVHRLHLRNLMDVHFAKKELPAEQVSQERFVFPDNGEVAKALQEAHAAVQTSKQHLEELLEINADIAPVMPKHRR